MKIVKIVMFTTFFTFATVASAENIWVKAKGGIWEPNDTTLIAMKSGIERYVKTEAKIRNRQLLRWDKYVFQYIAYKEKDKKYLLVNGICDIKDRERLENFMIIDDGGSCYFSFKFNPENKQYYDLSINGPG